MRTTVLDHGYVELIESWGSDERIIEAARMSTDKGFKGWGHREQCEYCGQTVDEIRNTPAWMECVSSGSAHNFGPFGPPGDEKLLAFLYNNKHLTPFEQAGFTIEVQAPIFVFREWHRHRTQSYNELSARYTPLPDVNYIPTVERIMMTGGSNKQAQSTGATTTTEYAEDFRQALTEHYKAADALYRLSLGAAGIPKELARLCIPVGRYSRMRASANLRNWLQFLTLRLDSAAQWEIRQYAQVVSGVVAERFPRTYGLFIGA